MVRDEKGISRPDMLQLMMDDRNKKEAGRELSILDMTSQVFIFFFAGFDSSSTSMSFTMYELAINPDIQRKLQNEIDQVLEDTNGRPSYDDINRMTYLVAVINESLRMHPAQPVTDRVCSRDFELPATLPGAKPYLVKKEEILWIPFYALHHDPEYFPEPNKFKPERFLDDNKDQCNLNAYFPFGLGPRSCIGNRFALLEMKVMLFHLLARCDLKSCERTVIPLKLKQKGLSIRIAGGCWLNVVPRKNLHSTIAK
jgi:cytochrome P450 family 9